MDPMVFQLTGETMKKPLEQANCSDTWATLSKKVFWDRDVALDRWRARVAAGHRSYLPDSIATMTPVEFVRFYGLDHFKRDWPLLRAALPKQTLKSASVFDVAWSHAVGGGWNLVPAADYHAMAAKRRAFLTEVARVPGKSIYEVAKNLGMQYRRAHDHAKCLIAVGKIRPVDAVENGLRKRRLYPKRAPSI